MEEGKKIKYVGPLPASGRTSVTLQEAKPYSWANLAVYYSALVRQSNVRLRDPIIILVGKDFSTMIRPCSWAEAQRSLQAAARIEEMWVAVAVVVVAGIAAVRVNHR